MATRIDKEGATQALWLGLTLRVMIGLGITWLLCYMQGAFGLVFAVPVWRALLAKPILEVISTFTRGLRASAFADWAGAIKLLTASRHPDAHKLRLLLERQVFLPARKRRERAVD